LAGIDVSVDYPEEDIEEQHIEEIKIELEKIANKLDGLLSGYSVGKKIKTGVTVAICGKPNTGKSSLLNCILGYEKAIVSSIAGTTRDAVEGVLEINGVKFNLYDTAGVRESGDVIESIGIERAQSIVKGADVVVFVSETDGEYDEEELRVLEMANGKPMIRIRNKSDLVKESVLNSENWDITTSAVTGEGIEELKEMLYEKSLGERSEDAAFLIEERHYDALRRARVHAENAIFACGKEPLDLIGIDVKGIWDCLGEITGETATESIINEIFEKFCVGK
jgi:tRNA modification GTPase